MSEYAEYVRLMRESRALMVEAERDFAEVTQAYQEEYGTALGELKASSDTRRRKAQRDWSWACARATAYAAMAEAVRPASLAPVPAAMSGPIPDRLDRGGAR